MPRREVQDFIAHWSAASASERANSQPFLLELCDLLGVASRRHSYAREKNGKFSR